MKYLAIVNWFFITLSISLISNSAHAESSVWKVSKGSNYLYLGGTVHALPASEYPLPKEFQQAYQNSDSLVLETKLPDPTDAQAQQAMMMKMSYLDGSKLSDRLTATTTKKLKAYFSAFDTDFEQLNTFKAGFVVMMMAVMEINKAQITSDGVDAYFDKQAAKDNKKIEYLESVDFQLNLLANMGVGIEETFVKLNLDYNYDFKELFSVLLSAWRVGDTVLLDQSLLTEARAADAKSFAQLFTDRNKSWIPLIDKMFTDQDTEFVLVGAGHLVGAGSVIELLISQGYTVEKL